MKGWAFFITLLAGVAIGVAGMVYLPEKMDSYLPGSLGGKAVTVEGKVMEKMKKDGALLLTVNTPQGALLATVKKRVDEVGLLVGEGDRVEFVLRKYRPFIEDPVIKRVRKGEGPVVVEKAPEPAPSAPEEVEERPAAANAPSPGPEAAEEMEPGDTPEPQTGKEQPGEEAPEPPALTNAPSRTAL